MESRKTMRNAYPYLVLPECNFRFNCAPGDCGHMSLWGAMIHASSICFQQILIFEFWKVNSNIGMGVLIAKFSHRHVFGLDG